MTDDHLWISIMSRPTKSSFTRLQRLTCGVSLLFSTMIANAMFYRETDVSRFVNDIVQLFARNIHVYVNSAYMQHVN